MKNLREVDLKCWDLVVLYQVRITAPETAAMFKEKDRRQRSKTVRISLNILRIESDFKPKCSALLFGCAEPFQCSVSLGDCIKAANNYAQHCTFRGGAIEVNDRILFILGIFVILEETFQRKRRP